MARRTRTGAAAHRVLGIPNARNNPFARAGSHAFRAFADSNRRLCNRFDRRLDVALYQSYDTAVASAINHLRPGALVVDVGGGRTCSFASHISSKTDIHVVAVDVSADELAANETVDETRLGDVSRHLPFDDGEADLVVSRTVLEHVDSLDRAAREMARVLRPGGQTLHLLPCRYALFAIVARLVPFRVAKWILHRLLPESRGVVEFDVHYERGHPSELERTFTAAGFTQVHVACTWDQAAYFHFFFPLFVIVLVYQRVAALLRLRILASYAIVYAQR